MEKSRLLMKEQPLVIDRVLAKLIGLNEAIVLQQIEYWTNIKEIADTKKKETRDENFVDGHYWTYNSVEDWTKEFPFWSYDTVKRTLKKLREKNLIVVGNFNLKGYDRTLWYRANHEELIRLETDNSANCPNEENSKVDEEKIHKPLETDNSADCPNAIVQNAPMQKGKMPQPIPKTSTKTTTKIPSSSSRMDLFEVFKDICELKKTTKPKFEKIVESYDSDFVLAVIEECTSTNVKSFSGFEVAFNSYIERNCKTKEDVLNAAANYRQKNKKTSTTKNYASKGKGKSTDLKFNNFEGREYDYDSLEKKLLGWE